MGFLRSGCGVQRMDKVRNYKIKIIFGILKRVVEMKYWSDVGKERMDGKRFTSKEYSSKVSRSKYRERARIRWKDRGMGCMYECFNGMIYSDD